MKFESFKKFKITTIKSSEIIKGGNCTQGSSTHVQYDSSHEARDGTGIGSGTAAGDDAGHLYGDTTED